jgi:hypothetical protein
MAGGTVPTVVMPIAVGVLGMLVVTVVVDGVKHMVVRAGLDVIVIVRVVMVVTSELGRTNREPRVAMRAVVMMRVGPGTVLVLDRAVHRHQATTVGRSVTQSSFDDHAKKMLTPYLLPTTVPSGRVTVSVAPSNVWVQPGRCSTP